ncbi:hypothetical protein [Psychroflexus sp. MES1-P1E]|uniref:hypothetical protein n=1 Tax=Psychroflexus sp. MES1-P1E TaxID=2058320 RepID=UPI000CB45E1D|nr:hypothetical protein [Psychroflexus sp. MES1-P1E]PKG42150.1 hypothetical protein CXF67_12030 [Psychroflexus sp. MES1-P1E]
MKLLSYSFALLLMLACSSPKEKDKDKQEVKNNTEKQTKATHPLVASLEKAHQLDAFQKEDLVSFDIELNFNGQDRLKAKIYSTTNSSQVKVVNQEGTELFFDGSEVWIHPEDSLYQGARFDALTWSYFFMAPYKLNDIGTYHSKTKPLPYQDDSVLETTKLTFGNNVGDSPDDWYVVYQRKEDNLLAAMAYIVTFGGKSEEKASQNPHAINYEDYKEIDSIPFAHRWTFWNWSETEGLKDQIGEARISNIDLTKNAKEISKKQGSVPVSLN